MAFFSHRALFCALLALWACDKTSSKAHGEAGRAYELSAEVKGQGSQRMLQLQLRALQDFKVNSEYPMRFVPARTQTEVLFSKTEFKLESVKNSPCPKKQDSVCAVETSVPFEVTEQATHVDGVLKMSVCSLDKCLIEKVAVKAKIPQG